MVALMLMSFMAIGAIAADIGRFYVVSSELQTAADAAALAGAAKLQVTAGNNPEVDVDTAVVNFVAIANKADNAGLAVTVDDVDMAIWQPGATEPVFDLGGSRPNAVRVTTSAAPMGVFAQVLGHRAGRPLSRSAVAWVANMSSNCVRPWAFPYLPLYKAVSGNQAATAPAPDLDPGQFVEYEHSPASNRMYVMLGSNQTSTRANDGNWMGFNFTGNAGRPGFQDGISGCRNYPVSADAGDGVTLPGQADQYVRWSTQSIEGARPGNASDTAAICWPMAPGNAGCYKTAADTIPGVPINVAWGDPLGNGSNTVNFRYVGEFMLTCYFKRSTDVCPLMKPGVPNTGYPEGTLVGIMGGLKSRKITRDDVLGNTPSNVQRLVLVK